MSLNKSDVICLFKNIGVRQGDTMFIHSDALVTIDICGNNFNKKAETLIDAMIEVVGENGTIVFPTFTYSATKGEVFNLNETKSEVGALSEFFRNRKNVKRSLHPVFSVAAIGSKKELFANSIVDDCFGEKTCFDLLFKLNAWIFTMGCSFDRITFIHYIDQKLKVDHRYFKSFPAFIDTGLERISIDLQYYVRDLNRQTTTKLDSLKNQLKNEKHLIEFEIGRSLITGVKAIDFYNTASKQMLLKSNIHITEGY
jgi:aminoglycoside 3-N-acetyltransferase